VTDDVTRPSPIWKTGLVKFFDSRKGFGFVKPDDGSRDVFISVNKLPKALNGSLMPDTKCKFKVLEHVRKGPYVEELVVL
jgi:CspA family cold shock protein